MTAYFTLNILRSSPRRHRGERTTTIPMKTPPLPVEFAVDGCSILCGSGENVNRASPQKGSGPPRNKTGARFRLLLAGAARLDAPVNRTPLQTQTAPYLSPVPARAGCHPQGRQW